MSHTHRFTVTLLAFTFLLGALQGVAVAETPKKAEAQMNIDTATAEELARLPRVGPAVAGRIVELREQEGESTTSENLMLVCGIGEKTFALFEPYIALKGETALSEEVRVSSLRSEEDSE